MQSSLVSLSNDLAKLVQEFQSQVVAVHARSHYPSSGVHWRPGVVVTADHTMGREEDIQVTLPSGERVDATFAGRDPGTDIAVLKVAALGAVPTRKLETDPAQVGELALVLGRSPDSGPNASLGVISARSGSWRTWRGGRLDEYIRLDATLFPNSSGGAVVDSRGQLLGIATSGLSRIAGLVIPSASIIASSMRCSKRVTSRADTSESACSPWPFPRTCASLGVKGKTGVMVVKIERGGPADKAGIFLGDILLAIGATELQQIEELQSFSDSGVMGKPVKAKLIRAGELREG